MAKKPIKKGVENTSKNWGGKKKGSAQTVKSTSKKQSEKKERVSRKGIPLDKNKGLGLYIRIKSLLWKNYKQNYKSYDYREFVGDGFLSSLHNVFEECKTSGADCPEDVILTKYQQIVDKVKRPEPFILPRYLEDPKPYFDVVDIELSTFDPYLWINVPMISANPSGFFVSDYLSSNGRNKYELYVDVFKDWVDWCNQTFYNVPSEDYHVYFLFTPPVWNNIENRWETEIKTVTASGRVDDFGYTPAGGKIIKPPLTVVKPDIEVVEKEEPIKLDTESGRLFNKKIGYLREKQVLLNEIKIWSDIKQFERMNKAMSKLDNVDKKITITNKQIDSLK